MELFSKLPTTSSFFKVSNKLFAYVHIPKEFARIDESYLSNKLYIPLLIIDLEKKGIVKTNDYLILEYSRGKSL